MKANLNEQDLIPRPWQDTRHWLPVVQRLWAELKRSCLTCWLFMLLLLLLSCLVLGIAANLLYRAVTG